MEEFLPLLETTDNELINSIIFTVNSYRKILNETQKKKTQLSNNTDTIIKLKALIVSTTEEIRAFE